MLDGVAARVLETAEANIVKFEVVPEGLHGSRAEEVAEIVVSTSPATSDEDSPGGGSLRPSQPSATSSVIITANPTRVSIVATWACGPRCASGVSSSVTTKIMAPAANASA